MTWLDTLAEIRRTDWSKVPEPDREGKAREVIMISSMAGAASAAVPVPFVDLALLMPIHTTMVMTVGKVFGRELSSAEAKRVALELGAIAGVTLAGHAALSLVRNLLPLVKWATMVASAASGFAITWGFGQLSIAYFKHPELSRDDLGKIFKDAMAEGAKLFSKDAFDQFRAEQDANPKEQADPKAQKRTTESSSSASASAPPADEESDASSPEDAAKGETMRPKKRSL